MAIIGTILLTILKIILIIVCVIAALLCVILFVPVRYELSGEKKGSDLSGHVEVTFLFRAIAFRLKAEKKGEAGLEKSIHFFIFGIDPKEQKEKRRQKKKEKHHRKKREYLDRLKKEDPEKYEELKREAQQRKEARKIKETENLESRGGESPQDEAAEHSGEASGRCDEPHPAEDTAKKAESGGPRVYEEPKKESKAASKKRRDWSVIPYKIIEAIGRFFSKLCHISNGISYWFSFLTSPLFLNALHHVSKSVIRLLKAIFPKRLYGRVEMGFDDPSTTGKALAFACAYLKAYGPDFYVIPDFNEKKLEGNVSCTGKIRLILPARLIVSLLLDRNVRQAYHIFKNRKEEA